MVKREGRGERDLLMRFEVKRRGDFEREGKMVGKRYKCFKGEMKDFVE